MSTPDARNLAIALEIRARHRVKVDGTCLHCLPAGTRWPCSAFQVAAAIVEKVAAEWFPPPPVHLDWLDGGPAERPGRSGRRDGNRR